MISIPVSVLALLIVLCAAALAAAYASMRFASKVLGHLDSVNTRLQEITDASARFAEAQSALNASQQRMNDAVNNHLAAQRKINDGLSFFLVRRGVDRKPV